MIDLAKQVLQELEQIAPKKKIPIVNKDTVNFVVSLIAPNSKILEVGTAVGYSGIFMLAHTQGTTLTTVEIQKDRAETAAQNFIKAGLADRVSVVWQDALEFINETTDKFDFIFLDGAMYRYPYMFEGLKKSLNKNGLIVIDNALRLNRTQDKVRDKLLFKLSEFISLISNDPDFKTIIHDIGDGILVAIKMK